MATTTNEVTNQIVRNSDLNKKVRPEIACFMDMTRL